MKHGNFMVRMSVGMLAFIMSFLSPAGMLCTHAESDSSVVANASFDEISGIVSDATLESGALDPEIVNISVETGNRIDEEATENESYAGESADSYGSHDWSAYVSDTLTSRLSSSELALYDECDRILSRYLNDSTVDATRYTTSSYSYYTTSSVDFQKYGLDKKEAFAVVQMFLYNNPQYYFASSVFLTTPTNIWFTLYDRFADGDVRAGYTDSVFSMLDKWIVSCSDYETTTYMKEVSAHDKICDVVSYVSGTYDQSIYSVFMENKTVCAGYSEVFSMMLNAMGIDTMTVLSDCHAWNVVQLDDGKYYCVDVTWDDSLGGRYLFNVSEYNLKRYDTSANEHRVSVSWNPDWIPVLSSADYVPNYYDTTGFEGDGSVALTAPDNLSGTYDRQNDTIRIDWTEVAGASKYDVEVYDSDTQEFIGRNRIVVNHIRVTSVSGRNMLIKVRAVGINDGRDCYSDWSQITYINGRFSAYRNDTDTTLRAPLNLRADMASDGIFDLSWSSVTNASGYSILLYSDSGRQNRIASLNTVATGIHVTGIAKDVPVYAYVRAFRSISGVTYYSDWSVLTVRAETPVSGNAAPGVPASIRYDKKSDSSGRVTWTAGTGAVSTNVVVKIDSKSGTDAGSLNTSGTAFNLSGVNPSKTYYIGLQSVGRDGRTSEWVYIKVSPVSSSSGSGSSETAGGQSSVSVPGHVFYESITGTSGRISWQTAGGAAKYEVQISKDNRFSSVVGSMGVAGVSVKITGMSPGFTYYARVRSIAADGSVSDWTICQFTASGGSIDQSSGIVIPANLSVSDADTKNRLRWDAVSGIGAYTVEIYSDPLYTNQVASLTVNTTSVLINGMLSGKTYYIRIRSVSFDGSTSGWATYSYTKK